MWETICQFSLLVPLIAYFTIRYCYNYWQRKKIACVESNILNFDWYKLPAFEYHANIYRQLDGHKFGGFYARFTPKLMVRDPDLIKRILIKDFDKFHDRGDVTFDENEPITMHLFTASGEFWRNLRTNLTPAFTSSKIKYMFDLIEECAQELSEVIGNEIETDDIIDVKDFSTRYTIDVISSCAFGLQARTIRDCKSIFKLMASSIFRRSWTAKLVIFTRSAFPRLKKIFGFSMLSKSVKDFFFKTIEDTIRYRETNGVRRNDFLQILIDMRNQQNSSEFVMTNDILTAQCFLFFIAGHDTSSTTLSAALYEIAANTQVQNRLGEEIDLYLGKYDNRVAFKMVENMPYLHQVFSETLRKYPVLGALNRVCVENYQIPDTEVVIEKGTEVLIPVSGLHWDPKYFPNPHKFDPDRFEDLSQLSCRDIYLPFGDGPRNCIGSRFALLGVKLALIYLLRDFRFEVCPKTKYPFEFERIKISTSVKHEIFLRCSRK